MNKGIKAMQCDSCGAPVHTRTTWGNLVCDYCGTEYEEVDRYLGPEIPAQMYPSLTQGWVWGTVTTGTSTTTYSSTSPSTACGYPWIGFQ